MKARLLPGMLLCLALAYTLAALEIPMDPWTAAETINTRTLPIGYGSLLAATCLWLLLKPVAPAPTAAARWPRLLGALLLIVATLVLLELMRFWLALGALLALLSLWLGERRLLPIALLSLTVPLVGWLGVEVLLGLRLPA